MTKKIEFILPNQTTESRSVGLEYSPQPATKFIPEEYKNLPSYEGDDLRKPTVKKCIPFLDAMTNGYIIPFFQEYLITVDYENQKWSFEASASPYWNETTPGNPFLTQKELNKKFFNIVNNHKELDNEPGYFNQLNLNI